MNKQLKDVLQLLVMILPLVAGMLVWWLYSPMYRDVKAQQRLEAQAYLIQTYSDGAWTLDRQAMIEHYGFTDAEINPAKLLGLDKVNEKDR